MRNRKRHRRGAVEWVILISIVGIIYYVVIILAALSGAPLAPV